MEQDYLQLAGIQHFAFCRRQWALIHIENQWQENLRTVEGHILHEKAHDPSQRERRGDLLIFRGLNIVSHTLGVSGQCDVVEFRRSEQGVPLVGEEGKWLPCPVEYKRGSPKEQDADLLQLCAQAICLEEMLCCCIPEGAIYYGESRHRLAVPLSPELRRKVQDTFCQMHELYTRGHTPKAKRSRSCNACSLCELCLPKLEKQGSVADYLRCAVEGTE